MVESINTIMRFLKTIKWNENLVEVSRMRMKIFLIVVIVIITIPSCTNISSEDIILNENEIDNDLKQEIKLKNEEFIDYVMSEKYAEKNSIFTRSYIESIQSFDNLLNMTNMFLDDEYGYITMIYFESDNSNTSKRIYYSPTNANFDVTFETNYKYNIFSIMKFEINGNDTLVNVLYVKDKQKNEWKINFIDYGYYKINNNDAFEILDKSVDMDTKGHDLTSLIYAEVAYKLSTSISYIQMNKGKDILRNLYKERRKVESLDIFPIQFVSDDILINKIDYRIYSGNIEIVIYCKTDLEINDETEENVKLIENQAFEAYEALTSKIPYLSSDFEKFYVRLYNIEELKEYKYKIIEID